MDTLSGDFESCNADGYDKYSGYLCGCEFQDTGYSTTTGEMCHGSVPPTYVPNTPTNLPPGCTSAIGWSTTTGQCCGGN